MSTRKVTLLDKAGNLVAIAQVADEGEWQGGTINLGHTPADLRRLFDEFEEIVNGQMLSFLDEIQEKIRALSIRAVFEDGREAQVKDLQIYPSTGDVCFKFGEVPVPSTRLV